MSAVRAVAGQEPALEVDAPHVIGGAAMGKRDTRGRAAAPQLPFYRQSFAIEQRSDAARCRPILGRRSTLQIGKHLQRPPARMRPPHRKATLGDLLRNRLRMMQRCPRAIEQTLTPAS